MIPAQLGVESLDLPAQLGVESLDLGSGVNVELDHEVTGLGVLPSLVPRVAEHRHEDCRDHRQQGRIHMSNLVDSSELSTQ